MDNPLLSAEIAAQMIKKRESGGRYFVGYGREPTDLSSTPLDEFGFPIWAGNMGPAGNSRAAGAYQFEPATWHKYAKKLGIKDFSPASQDAVFRAAYEDQGFKPWAPYNSVLRSDLASLGVTGKMPATSGNSAAISNTGSDPNKNAGLSGQINMGPLGLPEDAKAAKDKVAEALKGQTSTADGSSLSSSMALLSLLGSYKITPITYDPWKYVPKVTLDPLEV